MMLRAEKLVLYETNRYMLLVGYNTAETLYRVIKLDRTVVKPSSLAEILVEDPIVYTKGGHSLIQTLALQCHIYRNANLALIRLFLTNAF